MEAQNNCFACGESSSEGLQIFGNFLCNKCEIRLLKSKAGKLDYERWIVACRRIWKTINLDLE